MSIIRLSVYVLIGLLASASQSVSAEKLSVYTVNYPLAYFAQQIGGEHVQVTLPVPQGIDPVYWVPNIAAISAFQQADLILLNGAGYAKWVDKVSLPRAKTVDTSRKFRDRLITIKEVMTHSHGAEGEHAHEGLAFTTWLDFTLAAKQAGAVAKAMSRKRPERKAEFQANLKTLERELVDLDERLKNIISRNPSIPLIMSHPVYEYLTNRYGMKTRSVHWEPDQHPGQEQFNELSHILATHPAKWMIWEAEPNSTAVDILRSRGIQSTVFDPCANVPSTGDFISVMKKNIDNLKPVFIASE